MATDVMKISDTPCPELSFRPSMEIFEQADALARSLLKDWRQLDAGQPVSEAARSAPRIGSMAERSTRIGHIAANRLTQLVKEIESPATETPTVTDVPSIMRYRRVISKLCAALKERERLEAEATRQQPKRLSCALRRARADVAKPIEHPKPMPVVEAPLEELTPFFEFLQSNQPFDEQQKEFVRGVCYDDGRIDLCKQVVGPGKIGNLMHSIANNSHVQHFLLGNNIVGAPGSEAIAGFISSRNGRVKTWYLAGNCIDTEGVERIADAMANDEHADALWLKRNPLGPLGGAHLGRLLSTNSTLRTLDLTNTGLLDEGTKLLFDRLHENHSLRILYLDGNGIGEASVPSMAGYFERLGDRKGVTSLWLGINRLGDSAVPLIEAVGRYKFMKRLSLGSNRMGPKSAKALLDAFADAPKLIDLELGMYKSTVDLNEYPNECGDEGAGYLAELVERNSRLLALDFSCNSIGAAGYERLATAIESNKSLVHVVAHDYLHNVSPDIMARFRAATAANLDSFRARLAADPNQKAVAELGVNALVRFLRHGKRIGFIDSIYRNNM
eukprot:TRINITY_DN32159_c0_g1_i1.p1 TRINITY_DN32159_c0_g1~~TRINITY_DN32159_c0_g1_i1.p1  ORF type:complete len:558 (+),score=185.37 TRINITY_DN32159_c0_g1_i1:96-1769(+)